MTDERQAAKMVQYHIEGEHVFPEPECPSCRLDEALRRAAEMLALDAKRQMGPIQTKEARNLAGWAEAIQEVERFHNWLRGGTSSLNCKDALGCTAKKAVAKFCHTMLGGDDA